MSAKEYYIPIVFQQKNIVVGPNPGVKYLVHIKRGKTVELNAIIDEIVATESLTAGDIYATISALTNVFKRHLAQGHPVKLGSLGTFSPAISGKAYPTLSGARKNYQKDVKINCIFYPSVEVKNFLKNKAGLIEDNLDITALML